MQWSPEQDRALTTVGQWLDESDQQVFRLFGYAGTGKTTLATHLAQDVQSGVAYMAYTGKAAYVMRQKDCTGATTIHSAIYHSKEKSKHILKALEAELAELMHEISCDAKSQDIETVDIGRYIDIDPGVKNLREKIRAERASVAKPSFNLNPESIVKDVGLVVVDECSMVDGRVGEDLLSFGTKVLVLGDPAQLPPVKGTGFFTADAEPDIMLTEIHRQARDNPIIAMATRVREGDKLERGTYGQSRVIDQRELVQEDALNANQILVGRNRTRHAYNRRLRQLLGRGESPLPTTGDRLVCLRNNHDLGLLNGGIWYTDTSLEGGDADKIDLSLHAEDNPDQLLDVEAHTHYFLGREESLGWWERKEAEEFDYGYALTVHKAQGSQWGNVLLLDESYCFRQDAWRWLYTGLTRAAERVTVALT